MRPGAVGITAEIYTGTDPHSLGYVIHLCSHTKKLLLLCGESAASTGFCRSDIRLVDLFQFVQCLCVCMGGTCACNVRVCV